MAEDTDKRWKVVNVVMNVWVPYNARYVVTS